MKMFMQLTKDYFWFYKESLVFMGHQPKIKTFFQAIPGSFAFINEQRKHYKLLSLLQK